MIIESIFHSRFLSYHIPQRNSVFVPGFLKGLMVSAAIILLILKVLCSYHNLLLTILV